MKTEVVGLLLAAGRGSRFGGDKLMQPMEDGRPMAVTAAENLTGVLPVTLAVVRYDRADLAERLERVGCRVALNYRPALGLSHSLELGIRRAPPCTGWVIALGDMPWINPETIDAVAGSLRDGASLAAPWFGDRRGHPVGISARWRDALLSLRGDQGAREILRANCAAIRRIAVSDSGVLMDVDTPADLKRGSLDDASNPQGA